MEVIIVSADGREAVLGKAACEAGEALAWFGDPANREPGRFADLWPAFVAALPRQRPDIESTYSDTGFRFPVPVLLPGTGTWGRRLLLEAERRLALEDGKDGLLERTGDLMLLVDLARPDHLLQERAAS